MKKYCDTILHTLLCASILLTACSSKNKDTSDEDYSDLKTDASVMTDVKYSIQLEAIANDLTSPVGMAVANDGSNRLFILEQPGRIRIVKNKVLLPDAFLDITKKLDDLSLAYSEKGLLGLAFHPQYKINGRFFVYYSAPSSNPSSDHKSVIAEYRVSKTNADKTDVTEKIILEIEEPESNHNGGAIAFGPDGFLYIGVGDGGGAGDRHGETGNGQNLNTYHGKILRIDVNSESPYSIPADNPFRGQNNVRGEIYAYGLRNPWRFSFDKISGKLFCGDVGQNKYEEVDIIEKGKNYGWRIMEGFHCYDPETNCNRNGLTNPIAEYSHKAGNSITGGYVYNGNAIPFLKRHYLFGDYSGKLFCLQPIANNQWQIYKLLIAGKNSSDINCRINSFGEDENGEVYVITQKLFGPKSHTGVVYKITK